MTVRPQPAGADARVPVRTRCRRYRHDVLGSARWDDESSVSLPLLVASSVITVVGVAVALAGTRGIRRGLGGGGLARALGGRGPASGGGVGAAGGAPHLVADGRPAVHMADGALTRLERGAGAVTRERLVWAVLVALSVAAVLAVFLLVPASLAVA
jgi:hypothetical protein